MGCGSSKKVNVEAQIESKKCLLIIDMQNDFITGSLMVRRPTTPQPPLSVPTHTLALPTPHCNSPLHAHIFEILEEKK